MAKKLVPLHPSAEWTRRLYPFQPLRAGLTLRLVQTGRVGSGAAREIIRHLGRGRPTIFVRAWCTTNIKHSQGEIDAGKRSKGASKTEGSGLGCQWKHSRGRVTGWACISRTLRWLQTQGRRWMVFICVVYCHLASLAHSRVTENGAREPHFPIISLLPGRVVSRSNETGAGSYRAKVRGQVYMRYNILGVWPR